VTCDLWLVVAARACPPPPHGQPKANLESVASVISPPRVRSTEDALHIVRKVRQELASPRPGTAASATSEKGSALGSDAGSGVVAAGLATRPASAGRGRARVPHRSDSIQGPLSTREDPLEAFPLGTGLGARAAVALLAPPASTTEEAAFDAGQVGPAVVPAPVPTATYAPVDDEEKGLGLAPALGAAEDAYHGAGYEEELAPVALDYSEGHEDADGGPTTHTEAAGATVVPTLWPAGTTPRTGSVGPGAGAAKEPPTSAHRQLTVRTGRSVGAGSHRPRAVVVSPVPAHHATFRRPFTVRRGA
jgi:hypothetical protein